MNLEQILYDIKYEGFFSSYLPKNFQIPALKNIDKTFEIYKLYPKQGTSFAAVEPSNFTMPNFSIENSRRVISIPEICSYINIVKYLENSENVEVLESLLVIKSGKDISFSPNLDENEDLSKFDPMYSFQAEEINEVYLNESSKKTEPKETSNYTENIIKKIKKSKGAKGILHIDIANFFGSIYTHFIPAIVLGYKEALNEYRQHSNSSNVLYKKSVELDKQVRLMNQSRTNGILKGPILSKIIAEALLDRIDEELTHCEVNYTRFMDDYEIYIYNEDEVDNTLEKFISIFHKYGLTLNGQKTKYEEYPFYRYTNLKKIISKLIIRSSITSSTSFKKGNWMSPNKTIIVIL